MDGWMDRWWLDEWMDKIVIFPFFGHFQGTQGPVGLVGAAGERGLKVKCSRWRKVVSVVFWTVLCNLEHSLCTPHRDKMQRKRCRRSSKQSDSMVMLELSSVWSLSNQLEFISGVYEKRCFPSKAAESKSCLHKAALMSSYATVSIIYSLTQTVDFPLRSQSCSLLPALSWFLCIIRTTSLQVKQWYYAMLPADLATIRVYLDYLETKAWLDWMDHRLVKLLGKNTQLEHLAIQSFNY